MAMAAGGSCEDGGAALGLVVGAGGRVGVVGTRTSDHVGRDEESELREPSFPFHLEPEASVLAPASHSMMHGPKPVVRQSAIIRRR